MGLASLGLEIGTFCDFLYSVLLLNAILGLDFLGLARSRPQVQIPQLEAMAKFNPESQLGEFAASLGNIMENGSGQTPLGVEGQAGAFGAASGTLFAPKVHFASVPIRVQGQTVATMCVMDRKHHSLDGVDKVDLSVPARGVQAPFAFSTVNRFYMAVLYGRAGCLIAKNCGFWLGQRRAREVGAAGGEGPGSAPRAAQQ
jgi:hypothetical protein